MRRSALALLGALVLVVAGCGGDPPTASLPTGPAPPQALALDWVERAPEEGEALTFRVRALRVTETGWSADVGIDNGTGVTWNLGTLPRGALAGSTFGLLLMPTGSLDDLRRASEAGTLPAIRRARRIEPPLPATLAPGALWDGRIAADGRLPAGIWVRVAFGPLVAVEDPPPGLAPGITWITDASARLRG